MLLSMSKSMYYYSKLILEQVSFDPILFGKELQKAISSLLPYEVELLKDWVESFIEEKPELSNCLVSI